MPDRRGRSSCTPARLVFVVVLALAGCETAPPAEDVHLTAEELAARAGPVDVREAEADLAAGRLESAKTKFVRLLAVHENAPRARLGLAETLLAAGEAERALESFDKLTDDGDYIARGLQGKGLALLALERAKEAGEALLAAVEIDDELWRAWNGLGRYHDLNSDWAKAAEAYDRALALKPEKAILHNNRGMSLLLQGEYARAAKEFRRALDMERELPVARTNLRLALALQGHYDEAVSGVGPKEAADVYNNAGFAALLRGDYGMAERLLLQAMEKSPGFHETARQNLEYLRDLKAKNRRGEATAAPEGAGIADHD